LEYSWISVGMNLRCCVQGQWRWEELFPSHVTAEQQYCNYTQTYGRPSNEFSAIQNISSVSPVVPACCFPHSSFATYKYPPKRRLINNVTNTRFEI
jgi:hypothetical protein